MFIKAFLGLLLTLIIIISLGVGGAYYYVWPTFFDDRELDMPAITKQALISQLEKRKFDPSPTDFYFGAPTENIRNEAEERVNRALKAIIKVAETKPKKSAVLFAMKVSLKSFDDFDSEEKDMVLIYFSETLEIMNIDSSNELFNVWRYGFPYGWVL